MKLGRMGVACVVGLIVGVMPGAAYALSCSVNLPNAPWPDQTDVPTDARLWGYPADRTRLLGPANELVPMDARAFRFMELGDPELLAPVLVPRDNLLPDARYTIEVSDHGDSEPWRVSFVTGAGPAGAAPAPPTLVSSEPGLGSYYDGSLASRWMTLEFEGIRERGLILIGDTDDQERAEPPSIEDFFVEDLTLPLETLLNGPRLEWASTNEGLSVGRSDCMTWPNGAGDALDARFGLLDLAGNFSGWVEVPLELPSAAVAEAQREASANENIVQGRPSACAMTPSGIAGSGSLGTLSLCLGLLGAALRRMRPDRRAPRCRRLE